MILEFVFVFDKDLKVVASSRRFCHTEFWVTEEKCSSLVRYSFGIVAKTPKALVPSGTKNHLNEVGDHYWSPAEPSKLLAARRVSKEFNGLISGIFFGMNTFELHDSTASLSPPGPWKKIFDRKPAPYDEQMVIAHRWLEMQSKHGHLTSLRKLKIDIAIQKDGQRLWHVHRTFLAIVAIPKLQRVVVTLDLGGSSQ